MYHPKVDLSYSAFRAYTEQITRRASKLTPYTKPNLSTAAYVDPLSFDGWLPSEADICSVFHRFVTTDKTASPAGSGGDGSTGSGGFALRSLQIRHLCGFAALNAARSERALNSTSRTGFVNSGGGGGGTQTNRMELLEWLFRGLIDPITTAYAASNSFSPLTAIHAILRLCEAELQLSTSRQPPAPSAAAAAPALEGTYRFEVVRRIGSAATTEPLTAAATGAARPVMMISPHRALCAIKIGDDLDLIAMASHRPSSAQSGGAISLGRVVQSIRSRLGVCLLAALIKHEVRSICHSLPLSPPALSVSVLTSLSNLCLTAHFLRCC